MKNFYINFGILIVFLLIINLSLNYISLNTVEANPDYICVKSMVNQPCVYKVSDCGNWNTTTHQRACIGTKTTEVSYYLRRTTCESGYSRKSLGTSSGGSGGRQSSDFVSRTKSCIIYEVDDIEPSGKIN